MVFEALHQTIGRRAAIKILHANLASDGEYSQRFLNEAVAVNSIDHPGIVEIYDLGSLPDGTTYLVMEFIEGETLTQRLVARGGKMSPLESVWIGKEVAIAVAAAHAKGVVHRDLKPDNIMLARDSELLRGERVKLLDFGIAKLTGFAVGSAAQTQVGAVMGTLWYISPEQLRNTSQVDDRADVFSLGALLYHLLSSRPPIHAGNEYELIAHYITNQTIEPIAQVAPTTPPTLADLVTRMLAVDAAARPSMFDVAAELSRIEVELEGETEVDLRAPSTIVARSGGRGLIPAVAPSSQSGAANPVPPPQSSASTMSGAASESALPARAIRRGSGSLRLAGIVAAVIVPALVVLGWVRVHRAANPSATSVGTTPVVEARAMVAPATPVPANSSLPPTAGIPSAVGTPKVGTPKVGTPKADATNQPGPSSNRLKSGGCEKVNITKSCVGKTSSSEILVGIVAAARTAEIRICRGKKVTLQRMGQQILFPPGTAPSDRMRLFSQELTGFLYKQNTPLPDEVVLQCGD